MSALFGPEDFKDWLSIQAGAPEFHLGGNFIQDHETFLQELGSVFEEKGEDLAAKISTLNDLARKVSEQIRWHKASFNAAFMIKSPALLLNWSVLAFLSGLGIYLGCFWIHNLDETQSQDSSLKILIVYVVFTVCGLLLFYVPRILKYLETTAVRQWHGLFNYYNEPGDRSDISGYDERRSLKINIMYYSRVKYELRDLSKGASGPKRRFQEQVSLEGLGNPEVSIGNGTETGLVPQAQPPEGTGQDRVGTQNSSQYQKPTAAGPSGEATRASNQAEVSSTENPQHNQTLTDPVAAALEAAIRAQEQSTAALRALLAAHTGV